MKFIYIHFVLVFQKNRGYQTLLVGKTKIFHIIIYLIVLACLNISFSLTESVYEVKNDFRAF